MQILEILKAEICHLVTSKRFKPLQVFIFSQSEVAPGVYECWGSFAESWGLKAYVTWMTLAVFILPVLIITVCQVQEEHARTEFTPRITVLEFSCPFSP